MRRRSFLAGGLSALAVGVVHSGAVDAYMPFQHGGHPVNPYLTVATFQVAETAGAPSLGYFRIGLPIKSGDCPSGWTLEVHRAGGTPRFQFDNRASWMDGSGLMMCSACVADVDFSANETRTYTLVARIGSFDNTSSINLSGARSGTDFKVTFTSFNGTTTGAFNDHTASFNAHAAIATRVTKYESGPVCDSWVVWGMASDDTTSAEHAHIKANWCFSAWKDSGGAAVASEVAAVIANDWFNISNKEKYQYIATFKNGAAVIDTYTGAFNSDGVTRKGYVEHPCQSRWMTGRNADDYNHGRRHWIGASIPTLTYKPDISYWIATNLIPPMDTSLAGTVVMPSGITNGPINGVYKPIFYQPCSPQAQQGSIDAEGGSNSRGILTNMDGIALLTLLPNDIRAMIVNGLAGLGVPYYRVSSELRTRPGDSGVSDIANTIIPLIMWDDRGSGGTPSSYYDFTADGLPTSVHAYAASTSATYKNGWVAPSGGYAVGTGAWAPSSASSHAGNYCWGSYLYTGERHFLDGVIGLAFNILQQRSESTGVQPIYFYQSGALYPGAPSTVWSGVCLRAPNGNVRSLGWAANVACRMAVTPDNDERRNCAVALLRHNAKYLNAHMPYIPASAFGMWKVVNAVGTSPEAPWMDAFCGLGCWSFYGTTRDENMRAPAEYFTKLPLWYADHDKVGMAGSYEALGMPFDRANWNATTNDWLAPYEASNGSGSITAATNTIVSTTRTNIALANGVDTVLLSSLTILGVATTLPAELSQGVVYTVINATGSPSDGFQISLDGVTPITFGSDYTNVWFSFMSSRANNPADQHGTIYDADEPVYQHRAVLILARRFGDSAVTDLALSRYQTWYDYYSNISGAPGGAFVAWAFA